MLVVEGSLDPDRADPRAEGEAIVAAMPAGLAELRVIEGGGHYPHTQLPDETVALLMPFSRRTPSPRGVLPELADTLGPVGSASAGPHPPLKGVHLTLARPGRPA